MKYLKITCPNGHRICDTPIDDNWELQDNADGVFDWMTNNVPESLVIQFANVVVSKLISLAKNSTTPVHFLGFTAEIITPTVADEIWWDKDWVFVEDTQEKWATTKAGSDEGQRMLSIYKVYRPVLVRLSENDEMGAFKEVKNAMVREFILEGK